MDYFKRLKISTALQITEQRDDVIILGWVRSKRVSKNVVFIEVNDGSTLSNLQLVVEPTMFPVLDMISLGSAVKAVGDLVSSHGSGQKWELSVYELELVGDCPEDYPIQKKRHSFEFLREVAHLRPRTNTFGVMNRFRSKMSYGIHSFFQDKGFYYVHTPLITTNDGEGAGEMFTLTCLKPEEWDGQKISDYSQDFFGEHTFMTVTGQLEAEALASAIGDVYTFGPICRAEQSNTYRHLAEFWMIEPEMAFCTLTENMQLMEEFIKYLCRYALEHCQEEIEFFDRWIDPSHSRIETLKTIIDSSFGIVTYTEAVDILEKSGKKFEFPVGWGLDLKSEHERYLTEEYYKQPLMVINYPKELKPFYAKLNDDGKTVAAVDLLVPQIGEIIGGSERENRHELLVERAVEMGVALDSLEWYFDLRKWGSVPHSGFGLGLERMLMYMSGIKNIRDVIPFPRTPRNAKF